MVVVRVRLILIFAVLLASLLTVTQRASSEEATVTHWLEIVSEQTLLDLPLLEKDEKADADLLAAPTFFKKTLFSEKPTPHTLTKAPHYQYRESHLPRAPPYSLI